MDNLTRYLEARQLLAGVRRDRLETLMANLDDVRQARTEADACGWTPEGTATASKILADSTARRSARLLELDERTV